jgi:hypothetical protein
LAGSFGGTSRCGFPRPFSRMKRSIVSPNRFLQDLGIKV